MSNFENKGIKKHFNEIFVLKNVFLTYPLWPFPKEVFQKTSYIYENGRDQETLFCNVTQHVLNTAKI